MNKRIGFLSLFGITVLLLAMVGAITAMAAPSAANTNGTVTLDKAWYTIGSAVVVTVTDPDANIASPVATTKSIAAAASLSTQLVDVSASLTAGQRVGSPKVLLVGQTCPSGTADPNLNVSVFGDGSTGQIIVQVGSTTASAVVQPVCFNAIKLDTVKVTVKSTLDTTTLVDVTATETGVDTGVFKVTVTLLDGASVTSTPIKLKANPAGDSITAEYTDTTPASGASLKITSVASTVETQKPGFSNLLPAHNTRTTATQVTFSGTVTDTGGSGVDVGTISLIINGTSNAPTTVTGNSGDATVTYSFTLSTPAELVYTWHVMANDVAGNLGTSDSDTTTTAQDDHTLTIDKTNPKIGTGAAVTHATVALATTTTTGKFWDLSLTDPTEGKNRTTSLVVVFDADLDAATVSAADFTVSDNSVTAATIYTFTNPPSATILGRNRVYLTLGTALARNATPTVSIASGQSVNDLAGNVLSAGSTDATVVAKDGIAPSFTFSLDKTISKDKVVATVTSTETVDPSTFSVKGYPDASIVGGSTQTFAVEVTGTNAWKATFDASTNAGKDGKYSVQVAGKDGLGNSGTSGKTTTADPAAVIFTQDTIINVAPVAWAFTVGTVDFTAAAADVQGTSPLVSVNFMEAVTVTRAAFGVSGSEVDVLAKGTQSTDMKSWLYQASGLTLGKTYKIIVSATDLAGNSISDLGKTFNTIAVKLPETPLKPGQNLVSFTGNPVNGDINAVFSDASVTAVITYDPKDAKGPWLTATRGLDGKLSGTITKIDGQHSYFVKSSGFATIKVEIAKLGFDAVPSVISVWKGWNLVPVVSVTGAVPLAAGNTCATALAVGELPHCVSADSYLSTIRWVTAYTFDPVANAWTKIQPRNFENLVIGAGYWVYVSDDGILVP